MEADFASFGISESDLEEGLYCPCCGRWTQVYKRRMTEAMARWLVWLYIHDEETGGEWDMTPPASLRSRFGGDYAKLRHWGLVEQKPNEDKTKTHSGVWRITVAGKSFVDGDLAAPISVNLLNNEVVGFPIRSVLFADLYGAKFDIRAVMGGG